MLKRQVWNNTYGEEKRTMGNSRYLAVIEWADGSGSAFFPDLPGCVSAGDTLDELLSNLEEALSLHLDSMVEDTEPLPEPKWNHREDELGLDECEGHVYFAFIEYKPQVEVATV